MEKGDFHTALHRWAATPMLTAFLIAPLAFTAARVAAGPLPDSVAQSAATGLWLLLCGLAVIACLFKKSLDRPERESLARPMAASALFGVSVACLFVFMAPALQAYSGFAPYLRETSPAIFFLFALAWTATFGVPGRADIQRPAAWLGALVVLDALQALLRMTPQRFLGDPDMLATLLLIGLCADLKPAHHETDRNGLALRVWIMLGLLATLSRTGLFTAAWIHAFFGRGSAWKRLPYASLCAAAVGASFLLDAHFGLGGDRYMEYWVWLECFQLLAGPGRLYTGFALSHPLPVLPPLELMGLWQTLFSTSPLNGLFIEQIPSFWVRAVMAWGIIPP
ncbi:hypothetical protein [Salidesulfovibrio onnuriiensis]|uniref:hypothetical protein n=1 Tax=Salidesulfovibrio onnuriiensis TaxID=2583823 RepID=UPI0011CAA6A4|nr:hypothetical protein [Salidesulfovibrio onnuriiensis]